MGFFNKVFDVMGFVETQEEDVQELEPVRPQVPEKKAEIRPLPKSNNLVSLQQREVTVVNNNQGTNVKVVLVEPSEFNEAQSMADNLLRKQAVVINIEECDPDIAAKIIDFIGGVVYAIDGSIQRVSQGIVLAAPANIDIASELKQQLSDEQTEVFSWVTKYNRKGDF